MPMELWHDEIKRPCSRRNTKQSWSNYAIAQSMVLKAGLQVHSQS